METNYKITIPKPCHEDWNQMMPDQTGRFCNSCVKSVVDFTNMKAPEIQKYFIANQGKSVCGRFKTEQLDSIIIQIPKDVLFSQVQFHKIFMLALLISMGTTLFSCQNSNGDKQKIEGVEVVDSVPENRTLGAPIYHEDTLKINSRVLEIKGGKKSDSLSFVNFTAGFTVTKPVIHPVPTKTGEVEIETTKPAAIDKNFVYMSSKVEIKPNFPGGIVTFYDYFKSNFKTSENVNGRIILSFIVDTDGDLKDITVVRGINSTVDKEVINFMNSLPRWIPGEQNGEKVKVLYSLPIKITAQ